MHVHAQGSVFRTRPWTCGTGAGPMALVLELFFRSDLPAARSMHYLVIETCGCDGFGVVSASIVYAVGISSTRQSSCVDSLVFDTLRAEQRLLRHTQCPRRAPSDSSRPGAPHRARAPPLAGGAHAGAGPPRPRPTFFAALVYSTARPGAQRPIWHGTSPSALATCPQRGIALVTAL